MTATDSAIIGAMTAQLWTCLGCGDPLPPNRGGHCDACVEWETSEAMAMARPPEPDPIDEAPGDDGDYDPQTDRRCLNCAGAHATQRCPEIAQALRATHPGRAIWRHFHTRPRQFIETLRGFDLAIWQVLAASCADFEGKPMTAVLDTWLLAAQGTALPERVREAA